MGQRGAVGAPEPTNMSGMYSELSIPILKTIRDHGRSHYGSSVNFFLFPRFVSGGEQVADFSELQKPSKYCRSKITHVGGILDLGNGFDETIKIVPP